MTKKNILLCLLCCIGFESVAFAQENETIETKKPAKLYFGLGYAVGFFYPDDVNDYIDFKTQNYETLEGTTDMWLNFSGNISLNLKINKRLELNGFAEYAWAPAIFYIEETEESKLFSYTRFSPGLMAKYNMPIGSGRHSMFVGAGITYNYMKFDMFNASSPGAKLSTGISLNFGGFNMQPFVCVDLVQASDKENNLNSEFVLNYSGVELGINFLFKL